MEKAPEAGKFMAGIPSVPYLNLQGAWGAINKSLEVRAVAGVSETLAIEI
ncbi:MAG: hypothetical protein WBB29_04865 [Geitlerinemataceae cyanobacterium]